MTQPLFDKKNYLSNIYYLCVCLLAIGLCTSKALVSLSAAAMFTLALFSFKSIDFKSQLKKNKSFFYFVLFFIYYCLSTLWSSDLTMAIQDIVSKLTLVIVPFALIIKPIDSKWLERLYSIFVWSVLSTSIYNFIHFQFFTSNIEDIRELSFFVSHIRFSLFICFSIGLIFRKILSVKNRYWRSLYFLFLGWLLFYLNFSEVLSGILALMGGILVLCLIGIFKHSKKYKWFYFSGLILIVGSFLLFGFYLKKYDTSSIISPRTYPTTTKLGNIYTHDTLSKSMENGNYIHLFICNKEIDSVWPKISNCLLDKQNKNGYQTRMVLYRYLTSKGLTKDADGLRKLSKEDIRAIENGIPSILEINKGLVSKIKFYIKNFNFNKDPNGNSLLQRLEYWRVGSAIFLENPIIGVGIGDYKASFVDEYITRKTKLFPQNRLETHQQFLSILIATGCIGGCLFLLTFYFFIRQSLKNLLAIYFIGIILASFLVEDTLTTLAGMGFFGLFYGVFQNSTSVVAREVIGDKL